jgi:hypothetical protein
MNKEQFFEETMAEIKEKYSASIYVSELNQYIDRYYDFYRENIAMNPTKGFTAVVGWYNQRKNEFYEVFRKLGIKVKQDPIAPLHDYEHQLKESGMNRLSELEKKLNK